MSAITNLSQLKYNFLSKAQLIAAQGAGLIEENEFYITEEGEEYAQALKLITANTSNLVMDPMYKLGFWNPNNCTLDEDRLGNATVSGDGQQSSFSINTQLLGPGPDPEFPWPTPVQYVAGHKLYVVLVIKPCDYVEIDLEVALRSYPARLKSNVVLSAACNFSNMIFVQNVVTLGSGQGTDTGIELDILAQFDGTASQQEFIVLTPAYVVDLSDVFGEGNEPSLQDISKYHSAGDIAFHGNLYGLSTRAELNIRLDALLSYIHSPSYQSSLMPIRVSSVNVVAGAWSADSTYSTEGYTKRASVAVTGALSTMTPEIVFALADAVSGNFAPVCEAYNGGVYIYAKSTPAATITIQTITLWKNMVAPV